MTVVISNNTNRKLAKWAGFKPRMCNFNETLDHVVYPTGECLPPPNFIHSLDACIRWLFPKLTARCIDPEISYDHEFDQWIITLHNWAGCSKDSPVEYCKEADEIAKTFCLAVLELIEIRRE